MAQFEEEVLDLVLDGKTAGEFGVYPDEFDAVKTVAGPFLGDIVVLEEIVAKVDGVEFANIFDAKVNKD